MELSLASFSKQILTSAQSSPKFAFKDDVRIFSVPFAASVTLDTNLTLGVVRHFFVVHVLLTLVKSLLK